MCLFFPFELKGSLQLLLWRVFARGRDTERAAHLKREWVFECPALGLTLDTTVHSSPEKWGGRWMSRLFYGSAEFILGRVRELVCLLG